MALTRISTHAPREGSDGWLSYDNRYIRYFNPRSPRGERHQFRQREMWVRPFQPTLPARGATLAARSFSRFARYFNPRSPRGERLIDAHTETVDALFQPTLPARGATLVTLLLSAFVLRFQPTLPARGATPHAR